MIYKFHYILFSFILIAACKTTSVGVKDGTDAFKQYRYMQAADLLKKEISSENDNGKKIEKLKMLALAYTYANQAENAVLTYKELYKLDNNPEYLLLLGKAQMNNEAYDSAFATLTQYQQISYDQINTKPLLAFCDEAKNYKESEGNIRIENLENLNGPAADYAPRLYKNNQLVFTSTRTGSKGTYVQPWDNQKYPDLYKAEKNGSTWQQVSAFDDLINSEMAEGVATFTKDNKTMYFTRCRYTEQGVGYCKIYEAEADGDFWYDASLLEIFSDTVNIGQPFLSLDGKRLYFSSDAPFGYGGNDIYFMVKQDTGWSTPYNAGYFVNTDKEELFPTCDGKGNLYFSSNGRSGYGGLDIYKATPDKTAFSSVSILPFPINTGADDFSLQYTKTKPENTDDKVLEQAIFSSNRKGGKGNDDIYLYEKLFLNFYQLDLLVQEKNYANPNDANSAVLGLKPLSGASVTFTNDMEANSKEDGHAVFDLAANTDYKLLVSKKGYFSKSLEASTIGLQSMDSLIIVIKEQVVLEKIFPEKEIVIENIYYDYDKASLRQESLPVLDKLVSFFDENKNLTIEIGSHTDSRGSDSYNLDLSQRRAQSVVDYLISKGVPATQLQAKGYGETKLVNQCSNGVVCSEDEHQKNRRTTFRVISDSGVLESGE